MLGGAKFEEAPETAVPQWLDWDKWLGPAPMRSYSPTIVLRKRAGRMA